MPAPVFDPEEWVMWNTHRSETRETMKEYTQHQPPFQVIGYSPERDLSYAKPAPAQVSVRIGGERHEFAAIHFVKCDPPPT